MLNRVNSRGFGGILRGMMLCADSLIILLTISIFEIHKKKSCSQKSRIHVRILLHIVYIRLQEAHE